MKRSLLILSSIVVVLFVLITLFRAGFSHKEANSVAEKSLAEKEQIRQFWAAYRQATDYRIAGKIPEAEDAYRQALTLNGEHEDALYYLGSMCLELGRFEEARKAWERLAEINPHSARAHFRLGDIHLCLERPELFDLAAAETAYRRALEINKEETGPALRLGQVALMRNEVSQAQHYFDVVLGFNAKSVEAHYLHGYIIWKKGNADAALALFAKAAEYSRAINPVQGATSEGDTQTGRALDQQKYRYCQTPFQTRPEDLAHLEAADLATHMQEKYRALEIFLQQIPSAMKSDSR